MYYKTQTVMESQVYDSLHMTWKKVFTGKLGSYCKPVSKKHRDQSDRYTNYYYDKKAFASRLCNYMYSESLN